MMMLGHPANSRLWWAVNHGELAEVEASLDTGADPNALNIWDAVPLLHVAVRKGNPEIVQTLLTRGADPNCGTWDGSPLLQAITNGHGDIAAILIHAGAIVTWGATDSAITHESLMLTRLCLDNGMEVNTTDTLGATFLMSAAFVGCEEIVYLLLERRLNVNARTVTGWTALMSASAMGHLSIVRRLIAAGADVTAEDRTGDTALKLALAGGYHSIVGLLTDVLES